MSVRLRQRCGNNNCCVSGCTNNYSNTSKTVKFYSFPAAAHEKLRRKLWIKAIRGQIRDRTQGNEWRPSKYSRICSTHFLNNQRSGHPNNPGFVPTIFPSDSDKSTIPATHHREDTQEVADKFCQVFIPVPEFAPEHSSIKCYSVATQVNFEVGGGDSIFCFESDLNRNNASTQANVFRFNNCFVNTSDKCVATESIIKSTKSVKSTLNYNALHLITRKDNLNSRCGISFTNFNLLLSLLPDTHGNEKFDAKDKLILFLIKINCGLPYSALAKVFGTHRTTAARIFTSTLTILIEKTQNYVTWSSKAVLLSTQPKAFDLRYPNCRIIIDCTEIKAEQTADNAMRTYSLYKGICSLKFLLGISPNGHVSFVSKCFSAGSSDAYVVKKSGLLCMLEAGDLMLADKGFSSIKSKLSEEIIQTYDASSVDVNIERLIARIKAFNVLQKMPTELLPFADDVVFICCVLANLQAAQSF